ncbi:MAG: IS66 family transposase, partial [Myxococcales bacterium]|nr:IS66 family transposase [Myxococcales bacterium]
MPETASIDERLSELGARLAAVEHERDEYKRQYVALMEAYRKLEAGLIGQKRERFVGGDEQLVLSLLSMLTPGAQATPPPPVTQVPAHQRARPTGRKPLPEMLPRIDIEVVPPEVQQQGLNAFERIGEDVSETVEKRPASLVVVRTVRPKYVAKGEGVASGATSAEQLPAAPGQSVVESPAAAAPASEASGVEEPQAKAEEDCPLPPSASVVLQARAPQLPVPRALAGPGMLADSIVKRWEDHLPLHRLERVYGREGWPLARSTICGWHFAVALLCKPLVEAMWDDALASAYLCMDATGVLVQALEECRRAHFFVVVAPGKHVLFGYSKKHNSEAVDELVGGYKGYLVVDAHSVYEHLFETGDVVEVGCWAHARRYWYKSLEADGPRARHALSLIGGLFTLEREYATSPPEERLRRRQRDAKPIVDAFFVWCDEEALKVLDETPAAKAIGYARNQRIALQRFLSDGRLPIHNNGSENALRREA